MNSVLKIVVLMCGKGLIAFVFCHIIKLKLRKMIFLNLKSISKIFDYVSIINAFIPL